MRACPRPSIITFAGLRSRCSTPRSCAAASPAHSWRATSSALAGGSRPMRRSSDARSSPSMYSIVRKTRPCDFTHVVDAADVGMGDRARAAHLREQPFAGERVVFEARRKELQRHWLTEPKIVGPVHLAHPAAAEQRDDSITVREDGAGRQAGEADRTGGRGAEARFRGAGFHRLPPRKRRRRAAGERAREAAARILAPARRTAASACGYGRSGDAVRPHRLQEAASRSRKGIRDRHVGVAAGHDLPQSSTT